MNYRSELEVAKFASPYSVLKFAILNSSWNRVSDSDELWSVLLEESNLSLYRRFLSFKASFRVQTQNAHALAFVRKGFLYRYNCMREEWSPLAELSEDCPQFFDSSIVLLPEGSVMMLGIITSDSSKAVYTSSACGSVNRVQDTCHKRLKAGVICNKETVYTFGSLSYGESHTGEKLCLSNSLPLESLQWVRLANMTSSRFRFVPVEFESNIYLNGGWCNDCEVFSTRTETYSVLQLKLPEHNDCFSVVTAKSLTVFTLKGVHVWTWANKHTKLVRRAIFAGEGTRVLSAVKVKKQVFAVLDNAVYVFDMKKDFASRAIKMPKESID